jgi:hypothetical protein
VNRQGGLAIEQHLAAGPLDGVAEMLILHLGDQAVKVRRAVDERFRLPAHQAGSSVAGYRAPRW